MASRMRRSSALQDGRRHARGRGVALERGDLPLCLLVVIRGACGRHELQRLHDPRRHRHHGLPDRRLFRERFPAESVPRRVVGRNADGERAGDLRGPHEREGAGALRHLVASPGDEVAAQVLEGAQRVGIAEGGDHHRTARGQLAHHLAQRIRDRHRARPRKRRHVHVEEHHVRIARGLPHRLVRRRIRSLVEAQAPEAVHEVRGHPVELAARDQVLVAGVGDAHHPAARCGRERYQTVAVAHQGDRALGGEVGEGQVAGRTRHLRHGRRVDGAALVESHAGLGGKQQPHRAVDAFGGHPASAHRYLHRVDGLAHILRHEEHVRAGFKGQHCRLSRPVSARNGAHP